MEKIELNLNEGVVLNPKLKVTEENRYSIEVLANIPQGTRICAVEVSRSETSRGLTQGYRFFFALDGRIEEITFSMSRILNMKRNKMDGLAVTGLGFCHADHILTNCIYALFVVHDANGKGTHNYWILDK